MVAEMFGCKVLLHPVCYVHSFIYMKPPTTLIMATITIRQLNIFSPNLPSTRLIRKPILRNLNSNSRLPRVTNDASFSSNVSTISKIESYSKINYSRRNIFTSSVLETGPLLTAVPLSVRTFGLGSSQTTRSELHTPSIMRHEVHRILTKTVGIPTYTVTRYGLRTSPLTRSSFKTSTSMRKSQLKSSPIITRAGLRYSTHLGSSVELSVQPRVCLQDAPTSISAAGLKPYVPVTFKLSLVTQKGVECRSTAFYVSDRRGRIDLNKAFSLGGSYKGLFPAGLLTTLQGVGEGNRFTRLTAVDTATPWRLTLSIHPGHVEEVDDPLASVELERHLRAPGVERVEVESGRVRGALYIPPGPGPHPAVVDMFGGAATIMEHRAALLASHGILALALPYFGYRDLPKTMERFELEYFEEAVDYVLSQPSVIPDRCGVVAVCQGGAYGLTMGTFLDKVKAVFTINACSTPYETTITYRGETILKGVAMDSDALLFDKYDRAFVNPETIKEWVNPDYKYTIPIETASADTFFSLNAGQYDAFHGSLAIEALKVRMDRVGNNNYSCKIYEGGGHILEPPYGHFIEHAYQNYWPKKGANHRGPENGIYMYWGGSAKANCKVQEELWEDMRNFIFQQVQNNSPWYQNYLQGK